MIRYLYGQQLAGFRMLADSMFKDRAAQFATRHGWCVSVDENGWERDEYDNANPLYVIYELPDGRHGASGRLLPTTEKVMFNDHFTHLTDGVPVSSPLIWEVSRFCVSPRLREYGLRPFDVSRRLFHAAAEMGLESGVEFFVAVADEASRRVYQRLGWAPEVIGAQGEGRDRVTAGLWEINEETVEALAAQRSDPVPLSLVGGGEAHVAA